MTPGGNLLISALMMMGRATVLYFKDTGRTEDATGRDVTTFAEGVEYEDGQVQPVPRSRYQNLGLDLSMKYITWYMPNLDIADVTRGNSGDELEWKSERYRVESCNDWFDVDGWTAALCVKIGAANAGQ